MYEVRIYYFETHPVRVVEEDEEAWFVLRDICSVLGIKNVDTAARRSLRGQEKRLFDIPTSQSRRGIEERVIRRMLTTNESGVYTLIMRSDKPDAIGFRYWVTSEVLPTIRKTGSYTIERDKTGMLRLPEFVKKNESSLSEKHEVLSMSLTFTGSVNEIMNLLEKIQA